MFQSNGLLLYTESGWIRMFPHPSIGVYYKALLEHTYHRIFNPPLHGSHVTVLNGRFTDLRKHRAWKKYHNHYVPFEYSIEVESDQRSYWLPITSRILEEIRLELDLSPLPYWPFHMTIANLKNL